MFKPVQSRVSFPKLEEEVLRFWNENHIFEKSMDEREGAPLYVVYEGPPTANGAPGIHHVLSRVFKDLFPRYKTMQGFSVPRKGGWDTHGLPVELEVEKELKLSSKQDIEDYGIAQFNQKCRDSVFRYVKSWEELTQRIGFWIDMKEAYVTFTNDYIETCWWILKQLSNKGLLYEGRRVAPHCPRCVTTLSDHEVALGYQEDTPDPSVYVKFELDLTEPGAAATIKDRLPSPDRQVFLLAWTTTPWTLPGNTALAVNPTAEYALVETGGEILVLAQSLLQESLTDPHYVRGSVAGADLVGLPYKPLYNPFQSDVEVLKFAGSGDPFLQQVNQTPEDLRFPVLAGDFVSLDEGTGVVHIAPAFGDVDYQLGVAEGLYFVQQVDLQGIVLGSYPFAGRFVKEADDLIMEDLEGRGVLYRRDIYRHTYPFCWRCETPLLYYAKSSWYIQTTAVKDRLIANNEQIAWYPEHIKRGRFGEWLRNNVDWAISRERFWGTPLPVWRCEQCAHTDVVGGREELKSRPDLANWRDDLDLHRPYLDDVTYRCGDCSGTMRRIPEVIDCWFDSGAMPLAQWHYPFEHQGYIDPPGSQDSFLPADYICEAVDQTRGWFYSLHALSTLLFDRPCYENVICLGLILDAKGEKMSKSKGNVVDPWSVINSHGADAIRWYLFASSPPGNNRRFSSELVGESVRQFLLPLWNTYSFFVTYATIDNSVPWLRLPLAALEPYHPAGEKGRALHEQRYQGPSHELDRWVVSELQSLIKEVTAHLENYNPTDAGRRIQEFLENLSDWYVRRSRRRFWKSENDADKLSAHYTLYDCLVTLSKLLAPFTPFLAEELYQNLVRSVDHTAPESVHLCSWPVPDETAIDEELTQATRLAMRLASLGRAARQKAGLKVRQPLQQVLIKVRTGQEQRLLPTVTEQVKDELNVKELTLIQDESEVVEFTVKPNLQLLGPKYGKEVNSVTEALAEAAPGQVASQTRSGQTIKLGSYTLLPEEIVLSSGERPGYSVALEGAYAVAVATSLTPELKEEGLARELVHRIQNMRRSAKFEITDRIITCYQGDQAVQRVMAKHAAYIRQETLSRELRQADPEPGGYAETHTIEGLEIGLAINKCEEEEAGV